MYIRIKGYAPLEVNEEYLSPLKSRFCADTPYLSKLASSLSKPAYIGYRLPAKLACIESLAREIIALGGCASVSEPLAGAGLTARMLDELLKPKRLFLNDLDPGCHLVLKDNFSGAVKTALDLQDDAALPEADLIFADFNNFTFRRAMDEYGDLLQRLFERASKFLIINDCSVFYFRYGPKSFEVYSRLLGNKISSREDFFRAAAAWYSKNYSPWGVVKVAHFRDSAFFLLARGKFRLKLQSVIKDGLDSMISIERV